MSQWLQFLSDLVVLVTALVGFAVVIRQAKKTESKVDKVQITVNGNMRRLQAQFAAAIEIIEADEDKRGDADHPKVSAILNLGIDDEHEPVKETDNKEKEWSV